MKPWLQLGLVGLAAYLLFLVAAIPAAQVVPRVVSKLEAVQIAGVSGTLWSGEALVAGVGNVQLQDIEWNLRPLALFTGTLQLALTGTLGTDRLRANAGVSLWGKRRLTQVQGHVALGDVLQRLGVTQAGVDGLLEFDLDEVRWIDAPLPLVDGTVNWKPARIVTPVELDLGNATLNLHAENDSTLGDLNASGGQLLVQGKTTLQPDGAYSLDAELRTEGDVPPEVGQFLSTFTEYNNGSYRFQWSDKL